MDDAKIVFVLFWGCFYGFKGFVFQENFRFFCVALNYNDSEIRVLRNVLKRFRNCEDVKDTVR